VKLLAVKNRLRGRGIYFLKKKIKVILRDGA
jgi:hypothetical protein